jgi:hypothetical protein
MYKQGTTDEPIGPLWAGSSIACRLQPMSVLEAMLGQRLLTIAIVALFHVRNIVDVHVI